MANLTLALDDDLLRRARIRAPGEGTSVNAVVRAYLERYATDDAAAARAAFVELSREARSGSGPGGRRWRRGEIYDEATRAG